MNLEQLSAYKTAISLSQEIWEITIKWDWFAKDTVGKQLVRCTDSKRI